METMGARTAAVAVLGLLMTFAGFRGRIRFEQVSFRYDADWVLRDLDLEIAQGRTLALLGDAVLGADVARRREIADWWWKCAM